VSQLSDIYVSVHAQCAFKIVVDRCWCWLL